MRQGVVAAMLCCAAAAEAAGPIIPTNLPPVKLFKELNYELPGLAKVKAAVDAGRLDAAARELLVHFRSRPDAQTRPRPNPRYNTHLADQILVGRFIWGDDVFLMIHDRIERFGVCGRKFGVTPNQRHELRDARHAVDFS